MTDLPERKSTIVEYEKLNDVQKMYVRRFERFNRTRAVAKKSHFRKIAAVGVSTCALALGTYLYSLWAMKKIELGPEFDTRASDLGDKGDSKQNTI